MFQERKILFPIDLLTRPWIPENTHFIPEQFSPNLIRCRLAILLLSLESFHIRVYDLLVGDLRENSNFNPRILVSRNSPVAFVVGGAGFIGSHIVDALLGKGVQVICLDNFITGNKRNLESATRDKKFHLINQSIESFRELDLPRLDYAFFAANIPATSMLSGDRASLFSNGVINFLSLLKEYRSKICFVSSIELYDNKVPSKLEELKRAEIRFAKFAKEHKLNARVVRLAPLYGPRMHFLSDDPTTRLIQASLLGELQKEQTSLDFSSRALYIEDAVDLLLKSVFSGGTSQKIYDGALPNPVKVSDLKQVLLDPMWYEKRGFAPAEIPPWPTPNLKKTIKELAWKPRRGLVKALKETVTYFKENPADVPKLSEQRFEKDVKMWIQTEMPVESKFSPTPREIREGKQKEPESPETGQGSPKSKKEKGRKIKGLLKQLPVFLGIVLILYAIVYPLTTLVIGAFSVRTHLENASSKIQAGDFDGAQREIGLAKFSLDQLSAIPKSFILLQKLPQTKNQLGEYQTLLQEVGEGVDGASHAAAGAKSLFQITDIVSGADTSNPKPLFDNAQLEFSRADTELSDVIAKLGDESFTEGLPSFVGAKTDDFKQKLSFYSGLVEKGRATANFLPDIISSSGKKSYLVLFTNNLQLRGSGGFIYGYGVLDFENGKLKSIKVDATPSLDSKFTEHIEPPADIKNDLGEEDWKLSESDYDPDFPVSAKRAEFFYNKEAGKQVNGVIALDLSATSKILDAVGGVNLTDTHEELDGSNILTKTLSHSSEVATSSASVNKKYLISLQTQMFNKIFFLSKKNWPAIISALATSLDEKHMVLYLDDPSLFSYILSEDWAGSLPRGANPPDGVTQDFLASIDSNMGNNFDNYYLQRSYVLKTALDQNGNINEHLEVTFKNNATASSPASGVYRDRYRIYLPIGSKLTSANFDGKDVTASVTSFSDYNRAGYSTLLTINPGEQKVLSLDYNLASPLNFSGNSTQYQLVLFKQAGTDRDPFSWVLTYPSNFKLTQVNGSPATSGEGEISLRTELSTNRSLSIGLSK